MEETEGAGATSAEFASKVDVEGTRAEHDVSADAPRTTYAPDGYDSQGNPMGAIYYETFST